MNWNIHITQEAEQDLNAAVDYIEYVLKNPIAADNLIDEAEDAIQNLSTDAELHQIVSDKVLESWSIRFIRIKNYLAFYTIDKETNTVYIIRFLYEKSNWSSILKHSSYSK